MTLSPVRCFLASLLLTGSFAAAATLNGTATNGTTNKPAAGDDVVLIKLGQGMEEVARAKVDNKGHFSLPVPSDDSPYLVRIVHQGVTYNRMAAPGTNTVEVKVYDAAPKIEGVTVTADVMRFQAQGNELQGVRVFAVDNSSNPPRTQMSDQSFEFYLPEGAEVEQGLAATEGGQPLNVAPVPQGERNRYSFLFPLRPGQTQFQVVFHLPYNGKASIDPKPIYGTQHFVVMLPKTMQFTAAEGTAFQSMPDPRQSDTVVQVASNTQPGQHLAFQVAGTGILAQSGGSGGGEDQQGGSQTAGRDSRPGGGLGPPSDAPDPLQQYRWYLLGGFAVVLAGGAHFIARRQRREAAQEATETPEPATSTAASSASSPNLLLQALKEELFALELEHKQGHISQEEYDKAKAALDQTLQRAIKRGAS
ncbi:MAG: carboxypeptidase regulatory-like domain-containing protein [Acidobacteria bacterium]|nr:carboxypeptidase regulatory-like domain-containing protein [Acidobacteriota bacterium]